MRANKKSTTLKQFDKKLLEDIDKELNLLPITCWDGSINKHDTIAAREQSKSVGFAAECYLLLRFSPRFQVAAEPILDGIWTRA